MSGLRDALEEYLAVRRSLGYKLRDAGTNLERFVSFMEAIGENAITTRLAVTWAQSNSGVKPVRMAMNLRHVRLFAQYCSSIDPRTEIPPLGILPYSYKRPTPYIYSAGEVTRLMEAARNLRPPTSLRPWTYVTLFGLLATTGLRIGEAVWLRSDAVDLDQGVLEVRNGKFNKTRLVPVHESTAKALQVYAQRRDRMLPSRRTPWFFVAAQGGPLRVRPVETIFLELSRQIGLRGPTDLHGPRLHDFRHSFAVQTLLQWYRAGDDVEQKLPLLSTYLGHSNPSATYWYLSATPELLAEANLRVEQARRLRP